MSRCAGAAFGLVGPQTAKDRASTERMPKLSVRGVLAAQSERKNGLCRARLRVVVQAVLPH